MSDATEWCATLGCEGDPVDGEEYCQECIDISPNLVDDPDAAGGPVNPAGQSTETTECTETTGPGDPAENGPATDRYSTDEPQGSSAEDGFADADFTTPEGGVWPPALLEREQWMGHVEKKPFAPWADRDHPEADPDEDARWKWGLTENYVDGETIAIAEDDHRLDGRAFLQREHDPVAYVDGDDVLDPETGKVHPAFVAVLDRLGLTYADVTQSDGGAHAIYRGELPEGVKQAAWQLDDEPWGDHDEDDLPSVEIYAGKRVCVATGKHVPGTPTEVREWDADALREILNENDKLPDRGERHAGEREAFDLENYDPDATGADEVTGDIRDVYAAIDALDTQHIADETIVHRWNDDASTSDDTRAFFPTWGRNSNGTANIVDDQIWQDTGDEAGYGGPVVMALIDAGEMSHREASPRSATDATWYDGVDHLRELGFAVPVHVPEAGATNGDGEEYEQTPLWGLRKAALALDVCGPEEFKEHETDDGETYLGFDRETYNTVLDELDERGINHGREAVAKSTRSATQFDVERCEPPIHNTKAADIERVREGMVEAYAAYAEDDRLHAFKHEAGSGKTTTPTIAAAAEGHPLVIVFDKHAKAHEFKRDENAPDIDLHLKGAEKPQHDCCLDAQVASAHDETPECTHHGHPAGWDRMCPVYALEKDHSIRVAFDAVARSFGVFAAHRVLQLCDEDRHDWHDETCPWLDQFDALERAERVVGVHEYQLLKGIRETETVGERVILTDESPRLLDTETNLDVSSLILLANRCDDLAAVPRNGPDGERTSQNFLELGRFAREVAHRVVDDVEDGDISLSCVDPPAIEYQTIQTWVDEGDLLPTDDVLDSERRNQSEARLRLNPIDSEGYETRYLVEREVPAETLAQLKVAYSESTVRKLRNDPEEYTGVPVDLDAVLTAGIAAGEGSDEAGLPDGPTRQAIAVPSLLDSCPRCGHGDLSAVNGGRLCEECGWHEAENTLTQQDGPRARAFGWIETDPRTLGPDDEPGLFAKVLPHADELPTPLVLDATATKEKIAGFYGEQLDDVDIEGDEPLDLDGHLRLTQVVGGRYRDDGRFRVGGQYHAQTIKDTEGLQQRIQSTIDTAGRLHDRPLFGIRKDLIGLFDFPENGEVLHYGGARGLDFKECDAVVCIGAPHPNIEDLQRDAELLAMDRDDLRVGGEEYSTRRDAPNPPVYRKLLTEDENGDGLAVPTKAYSGLVGALFYEGREKEIEQFVHRIRPVLADELKHAYLLTDVPTDLPVDDVVGLEELADPIEAMLPVSEGAVRLLGHVLDAQNGEGPDGFRPGELVEERADGTIANKVAGFDRLARLSGEDVATRTVRNWVEDLEGLGLLTPEAYEQRRGVSYTADPSTSKRALQVLSSSGGFEVATKRRLASLAADLDSGLAWLRRALDLVSIRGDRCAWSPPGNGGGSTLHGG